jgi:18S rRNA (adenine1779-N6/adenine1780-N6)-dimethyltransferase
MQNYKVYCSLHNIPIDESIVEDASAEDANMGSLDDEMDVDDGGNGGDDDNIDKDGDEAEEEWGGVDADEDEDMPTFFKELNEAQAAKDAAKTPSRNPKSRIALVVRSKVNKVLTGTGLADKRARQCDQNDFLKLLIGRLSQSEDLSRAVDC